MNFWVMIKKNKFKFIGLIVIVGLLIIFLPSSLSALQPIKEVVILSDNLNYENKDPGSWKIRKSAEWVDKGVAEITFNLDTVLKSKSKYTDVIFVLDISGSMSGEKIEKVKQDSMELIHSILSNSANKVSLVTFASESQILSDFTNQENALIQKISGLSVLGNTNYYQAFLNVNQILETYEPSDDRETVVLFLTDGYPTVDTPNEVAYYSYLKEEYPFITINAIQYEMGKEILDPIKKVSDNQYIASMENLNNVLFQASVSPVTYDNISIVDYIDSRYFTIDSSSDVEASIGRVELEHDDNGPKVIWNIDNFSSGNSASLKIKVKLLDKYLNVGGIYSTNSRETIDSVIDSVTENIDSSKTPLLANEYQVTYDSNAPDGCNVSNMPNSSSHFVYDTIKISDQIPSCSGYQFKGWEFVGDVNKINDDYFLMPEKDVVLRATWSKVGLSKSMNGSVSKIQTIYKMMQENAVLDDRKSEFVSSSSGIDFSSISSSTNGQGIYEMASTKDQQYPIYYYRGNVNNNIKFANYCWKIVRTTETGGVKLIFNGVPDSNGRCNIELTTSTLIGSSTYHHQYDSISDVGYMYGARYPYAIKNMNFSSNESFVYGNDVVYSNGTYTLVNTRTSKVSDWESEKNVIVGDNGYHYTCFSNSDKCSRVFYIYFAEPTYTPGNSNAYYINLSNGNKIENVLDEITTSSANSNNSVIKETLDGWYFNNLLDYSDFIEDTVWCNDRTVSRNGGWDKNSSGTLNLQFSAFDRLFSKHQPNLQCSNYNDKFTVESSIGNGKLTYPIGLLTADEVVLAGGSTEDTNTSYYLNNEQYWWTMSPFDFTNYNVTMFVVYSNGKVNNYSGVGLTYGVRPAISLKSDVLLVDGDGTPNYPFVIE